MADRSYTDLHEHLKKLEAAGLSATKDGLVHATAKGRQALRAWLSEPVTWPAAGS